MAEILKEWLTERLQRSIKWEADNFGDTMKNGYIIASVLLSYQVINDEKHYLIRDNNSQEDKKNNWYYLKEWLRNIEIHLNDTELASVMEGNSSALLRLFYQLFLQLDKRDRTNFIKRERQMVSKVVEKMAKRFRVEKVPKEEEPFVDNLSKPLLNEKHYIEWQKKKTEEVQETYNYVRHKYKKMLGRIEESKTSMQYIPPTQQFKYTTEKIEMENFASKYPCKFENYSYEQLVDLEEKVCKRQKANSDSEWVKNYMRDLRHKINRKRDSEEFQKQIRNILSGSLWSDTIAEEESKFDTELAKKVIKLSLFEKQMCTQLMETKQQARNLVQIRVKAEKEFNQQRNQQFQQFFDNVKEQIHLELVEIDFEKQRQNMLHKKLYAEKMKRKRQHYYEICYETILSIVDYATKYAYFKKLLEDDIPGHFIHEWKILYYKQQPIFDIMDPLEDILKERTIEEEFEPAVEEVIRLELDRQEILNKNDFIEYHNYTGTWHLDNLIPNYDPESEERKYEYLGTRILGHVVYTLLEIKYPFPPLQPPAVLPNYKYKVILRSLPDRSICVPIQILLNLKKIHVVRLESAINFCLRTFKNEMIGCTDIEISLDKFVNVSKEEESKDLLKLMKVDDEFVNKNSDLYILGPIPLNTKQTQTPKTIPEEDIKLSDAAELGRYAYEALSLGNSLTDHLLAAMIVEYLKDQSNIDGFIIVNYPNSYRETAILEATFSGREPPNENELDDRDDIYLEESIINHRKEIKDKYKLMRISKIVNDPHQKQQQKPFESYFTCYIRMVEAEDILQEIFIWDLAEDNSELIDRFYAALGINYSVYYEVIDKDLLAQICKYVIGDFSTPIKSCDTLFGEDVLNLLDFPSSDDKRTKSKIVKPETSIIKSKEKISKLSKITKMSSNDNLEILKTPDSAESISNDAMKLETVSNDQNRNENFSTETFELTKILAGEEDWNYAELPIPENIGIALASCWEQTEKSYIHDMEQLFLAVRLQMNCLVPYARFIKDKMEQIITLPTYKQDLVSRFQKEYNDFENDWRDINLTKNEWHCRVKELQSKLNHICDERKQHAEQKRRVLICDNWAMEELTTMVNTYISCMQTELNRSILTFQALHDFYYTMIKRIPPTDRMLSKDLTKVLRNVDDISTESKKGGDDKMYRQLKGTFQELQLKNVEIDYSNNPFNLLVENNVKMAFKVIKDINDSYRSLISKEYSEIAKITIASKKKEDNTSEESVNHEELFKENSLKCIEEWTIGINGEMFRAYLRMTALQYKCYNDMKLFNDHVYKTFKDIQDDINNYYINEIKSVDRLCKYLQLAVENGTKIPESLILEHDTFIIDPNLLQLLPTATATDNDTVLDYMGDLKFHVAQLARLRSQFKIVAPTGIILQQAFIYLLQDFFFFGKESCKGPLFPEAWNHIDVEQMPKLVYLLYGETVYVDWRDFLIYCLNLRFPLVEELLEIRKRYRCLDPESTELVSRDNFLSEELWFEIDLNINDGNKILKKTLIKHFLFELYETTHDFTNYSAFLLAFCKSTDPIEGFAAALSMAVGKKICCHFNECQEVVCNLIKMKKYRDACLACAHKCTQLFLENVLKNVINTCEGSTILELEYNEPPPEEKKGKKGKASNKGKKNNDNLSMPKTQKSVLSKNKSDLTTEIKQTFICRPCEEEAEAVEEKPREKEEVEEEHKSEEPHEDPNLAYAVSQAVIWNVLKICLPWHFQLIPEETVTPFISHVSDAMSRLEKDTDNGDIYVCKFVLDPNICKLLHKTKKFTAVNLAEEVRKVCL